MVRADAVTAEFAHYAEATAAHFAFDGAADFFGGLPARAVSRAWRKARSGSAPTRALCLRDCPARLRCL